VEQEKLWHESFEDALRSCVDASGGFKRVGAQLWPSLPVDQAGRRLAQSLDLDRPEKLSLSELLLVIKLGRDAGCHVAMSFITQATGYETPAPTDPQNEKEKLQREFVRSVALVSQLAKRLEKLDA
jgi:hypothetical protein